MTAQRGKVIERKTALKAPLQTPSASHSDEYLGIGLEGGENLARLRLGHLGSIPGVLRICSRGQQMGLSFTSGPPVPAEGVKVKAVMQPKSHQARMKTWPGPQGALTNHLPFLQVKRKSWEENEPATTTPKP